MVQRPAPLIDVSIFELAILFLLGFAWLANTGGRIDTRQLPGNMEIVTTSASE